ncbi:unnamed protein product [Arabidopsis halleri]
MLPSSISFSSTGTVIESAISLILLLLRWYRSHRRCSSRVVLASLNEIGGGVTLVQGVVPLMLSEFQLSCSIYLLRLALFRHGFVICCCFVGVSLNP